MHAANALGQSKCWASFTHALTADGDAKHATVVDFAGVSSSGVQDVTRVVEKKTCFQSIFL